MPRQHTIICGAGIAGVASAYYLAAHGVRDVVLIDRDQPLSLTTAKSGENYRDYWPHHAMTALSTASIDHMRALEAEHGDVFRIRETGYLFASRASGHDIFPPATTTAPDGRELLIRHLDQSEIQKRWPHLSPETEQVVVVPRGGSIDVQALGNLLLSEARRRGAQLLRGTIDALAHQADGSFAIEVGGETLTADNIVLASGPFVAPMASQLGVDVPLTNVSQRKFVMPDPERVIPLDMPFTICADAIDLEFDEGERAAIEADPQLAHLLDRFPGGLHVKPEPGGLIKLGWAFNEVVDAEPRWSIDLDEAFPNIVLRGAMQMIPGLSRYVDALPTPIVQYGGYYNRTPENWPLIGPTSLPGLYLAGGLAGFGTMCGCATGDLVARHIAQAELPSFARYFSPGRYDDPAITAEIAATVGDGQL